MRGVDDPSIRFQGGLKSAMVLVFEIQANNFLGFYPLYVYIYIHRFIRIHGSLPANIMFSFLASCATSESVKFSVV